ncbi:MAG TPA: hypothetical protein VNN08_09660 [Thermoanaerobaculia bacterium]|nr:hypothetical protein [Thermoanaerobaculia bacterium]
MPRPRLIASSPQLSGGQASYVLDRLVADRRISPGEVNRYVSDMHREISDLESRLQSLRASAGVASSGTGSGATTGARRGRPPGRRPGRPPGRPPGSGTGKRRGRPPGSGRKAAPVAMAASAPAAAAAAAPVVRRRRRARITPEQLASRQLQGRYLGLIRQIPASKRAQYQKIAKDRGREAAINEMRANLHR